MSPGDLETFQMDLLSVSWSLSPQLDSSPLVLAEASVLFCFSANYMPGLEEGILFYYVIFS